MRTAVRRLRQGGRAGFTLIELLVAVILMVILLSAITLIFVRTTETVAISQARTTVYTNARYALDVLENDLLGCLSFGSGQQRFIMENGRVSTSPAAAPSYPASGGHLGTAADRLIFRTTTAVGNTIQSAEVCYELIPGSQALKDPADSLLPGTSYTDTGDPTRGETVRNPKRPLYTLVRRVRVQDPNDGQYRRMPVDASNAVVPDGELCYFVLSFNLEFYANNQSFSQIDQSSPFPATDPLGDNAGANDGAGGPGTGLRVPYIRVTMVIVDDVGGRQEREIQKTIWIPMG